MFRPTLFKCLIKIFSSALNASVTDMHVINKLIQRRRYEHPLSQTLTLRGLMVTSREHNGELSG